MRIRKLFQKAKQFKQSKKFSGRDAIFDAMTENIPVRRVEELDYPFQVNAGDLSVDRTGAIQLNKNKTITRNPNQDDDLEIL